MRIDIDAPAAPDVSALLEEHLRDMLAQSPRESVHALDASGPQVPSITFWSVRDGDGLLLGCGALEELDPTHGEVKSMRTPTSRCGSTSARASCAAGRSATTARTRTACP